MIFPIHKKFSLDASFLSKFSGKQPQWGPLGYVTYKRTYARPIGDRTEEWDETLRRVVEGCYTAQLNHCRRLRLPWSDQKAQESAQEMYQLMWDFKFLPPGRGLWMMGTDYVWERGSACLQNCGMVSTENIDTNFADPFAFMVDMSMLGVGVSFDTLGADKVRVVEPRVEGVHIPEDSKEGWRDLIRRVLLSYVGIGTFPEHVDYTAIRPEGTPIKSFGGIAPGPGPLRECVANLKKVLDSRIGKSLSSTDIVDLMNILGKCVVSGGVRRSAQLSLGDPLDQNYLFLKDPVLNKELLTEWRWASNNSIVATPGKTNYKPLADQTMRNGEPGYIWLENARAYGRMKDPADWADAKVAGVNPCSEQSLESGETCLSGATRIQTKNGCPKIKDIVGKEVEVWNGETWSKVVPRITGTNRKLYRVSISDGSFLDCTSNHGWSVRPRNKRVFRRIETLDLPVGSKVAGFEMKGCEGNPVLNAYEYGLFFGDGYLDGKRAMVCFCGEKTRLIDGIQGVVYKEQHPECYKDPIQRVFLDYLDLDQCVVLKDRSKLPDFILEADQESLRGFIAGVIDTDGSVQNQKDTEAYRVYISGDRVFDFQLILRRAGINYATISLFSPKGSETNKGIRSEDLWYVHIPSFECGNIPTRLKKVKKIGSRWSKNNAYFESNPIDNARKQKIVSVVELPGTHTTYCFDEPLKHMGVFGNVLTYQCNLVETFPSRHETFEEYKHTLKFAYLYAKTVTLIPTHNEHTNAITMRNRRIGLSQSGIVESFEKLGRSEHFRWCDEGYAYVKNLDLIYSQWLCVPRSIKSTSLKPSGTVSLLPGVTPGIHYAHSKFYNRTIRIDKTSPLIVPIREAGYRIEESVYGDNTWVVYFPVKHEHFERSKNDVTIWEQVENVAQMQYYWADNQVSATITFKPEEAKDIQRILELYEHRLKGISFLPIRDHKYLQAPYQEITEEEYEEAVARIKPLLLNGSTNEVQDKFCDGDKCTIGG